MKYIKYILVAIVVLGVIAWLTQKDELGVAQTGGQRVASSTTYELTTSSQRLLATSTRRVSARVQLAHCTAGGSAYLNLEQDAPATVANAEFIVTASSTQTFSLETGNIVPFESITAILDSGTCNVLVTEWRNR